MAIRLPYETKAGNFAEAETLMQLIEHLRLAAEAAYMIGHHRKENGDLLVGQMFLANGEAYENACKFMTRMATAHTAKLRSN